MGQINIPNFGKKWGIFYPLIWRILSINRYLPPAIFHHQRCALGVDLYILGFWIVELNLVIAAEFCTGWMGKFGWFTCVVLLFRLFNLAFIHFSILIRGFYRTPTKWKTGNRIVLLTFFSAIEILFIFGVLFRGFEVLLPNLAAFDPELCNLFSGIYLSVVTGTTLGYGIPHPVGIVSRILAMVESLFIVLIIFSLIGAVRGGWKPYSKSE